MITQKPFIWPLIIDNNEVNYTVNHPEPGMSCKTCRFFTLACPLEENESMPPAPRVEYTDDELFYLTTPVVHGGFCIQPLIKIPPKIIINIWDNQGCGRYEERSTQSQFTDDGDELAGPTVY